MTKIGIIGMSAGNAHPYSWSAIINGCFDGEEINRVGYPAVTNYLEANRDTLGVTGAKVTCVWTQDRSISESIARTTQISHIADSLKEMESQVDAVILSRDDPESHVAMAKPFIDLNIPVFIDKPLAITREDLQYFSDENAKGKLIMSCSSMRYANECRIVKQELASLGKIELINATGKKDWIKYGVHLMEAVFSLLDDPRPIAVQHVGKAGKDVVIIELESGLLISLHVFMDISGTFQVSVFSQHAWRLIDVKNSYSMFRDNIIEFIRSVQEGKSRLDFSRTENIIRTLIGGKESFEQGGKIIRLNT